MNLQNIHKIVGLILGMSLGVNLYAQEAVSVITTVKGTVLADETGEGLFNAILVVEGQASGVTTDIDGNFILQTDQKPSFFLKVSYLGYRSERLEIAKAEDVIVVRLKPDSEMSTINVVVSSSRIEQTTLSSSVSVEKLGALDLKTTPAIDPYSALAYKKGVQMNTGGITFKSINTRGFAEAINYRYVQIADGVDLNSPGLNVPIGDLSMPIDLDIIGMELVPGAGSALYGPNAFNGMLTTKLKDPFFYQGLSADLRGGIGIQEGEVLPYGKLDLRYVKTFRGKLAIKVALSGLYAKDWVANDERHTLYNGTATFLGTNEEVALKHRTAALYDAVNIYGDEKTSTYHNGTRTDTVSRSGISERDLAGDYRKILKANVGLHYKVHNNMTLSYEGRFHMGDFMMRSFVPLVARDYNTHIHKLEIKGDEYFARAYYSGEHSGRTFNALDAAVAIQFWTKSTPTWGKEYGQAYRGEIDDVPAQDHVAARAYADRDIIDPKSELFGELLDSTSTTAGAENLGSYFDNRSSLAHIEGQYDFKKYVKFMDIQVGGNARYYNLVSNGNLYNDGPNGFDKPIGIFEYGAYVQVAKAFWNDRITLRASVRADHNLNYPVRATPRFSTVFAVGRHKKHYIRASVQTAFRNPSAMESYSAFNTLLGVSIGGNEANIEQYKYTLRYFNFLTFQPAGTEVDGETIFENLVSGKSVVAAIRQGNLDLLEPLNLGYLKQEQITTVEIGYKSLIKRKLFIDAGAYYNRYNNMITLIYAFSPDIFSVLLTNTNIPKPVNSVGGHLELDYILPKDFRVGLSYNYVTYNLADLDYGDEYVFAFNTPEHRIVASFSNRNVWKTLGFDLKYRWWSSYTWKTAFTTAEIPSAHVLDAAVFYTIPTLQTTIKIGATNILGTEYRQMNGGPALGTQVFLSLTYNPIYGGLKYRSDR